MAPRSSTRLASSASSWTFSSTLVRMSTPAAVDAQLLVSTCLMVEERGPAATITTPVTSHCRTVKP